MSPRLIVSNINIVTARTTQHPAATTATWTITKTSSDYKTTMLLLSSSYDKIVHALKGRIAFINHVVRSVDRVAWSVGLLQ